MNDKWLNTLKNKMENHTEPAPEGLWDDLDDILFQEKKNRFVLIKSDNAKAQKALFKVKEKYTKIARIAAIILLTLSTNFIDTRLIRTPLSSIRKNHDLAEAEIHISTKKSLKKTSKKSETQKKEPEIEELVTEDKLLESKKLTVARLDHISSIIETETSIKTPTLTLPQLEDLEVTDNNISQPTQKRWEANFLASQFSPSSAQQQSGISYMATKTIESSSMVEGNTYAAILNRNENEPVYTDVTHKSPVTLGVSVLYHLNPTLSVGSGLIYTKLVSHLQAGTESDYISNQQTLHYIGVPLQLNYAAFQRKRLSAYVSSGVTIEKGIGGSTTNQYTLNPVKEHGETQKLIDKHLQVSVNALAGIQYELNSKLSIYLEPGIGYYFQNSSELRTIYKEKPLMLNTRTGIRFSLNR